MARCAVRSPSAAPGDEARVVARETGHNLFRPLRAVGDSAARFPYQDW